MPHPIPPPSGKPGRTPRTSAAVDVAERASTYHDLLEEFVRITSRISDPIRIMKRTGEFVGRLLPTAHVFVMLVDDVTGMGRMLHHSASPERIASLRSSMGFDPTRRKWPVSGIPRPEFRERFHSHRLTRVAGGTPAMMMGMIPEEQCIEMERRIGARIPYQIGFVTDERHIGGLTIITAQPLSRTRIRQVETLMTIASSAVRRQWMEQEMRMVSDRFRTMFDNAHEGMFISHPETGYMMVNAALARIYGYGSPEEFMSAHTHRESGYAEPEMRKTFIDLMHRDGHVEEFEYQAHRKDGSLMWLSENAHVVKDGHGRILYYEGTIQDISQRKAGMDRLLTLTEEMRCINRISEIALGTNRSGGLLRPILDTIAKSLAIDHVGLELHDPTRGVMVLHVMSGVGPGLALPVDIPVGETPSSRVLMTGKPAWLDKALLNRALTSGILRSLSPMTYAAFPLRTSQGIVGAMTLVHRASYTASPRVRGFATTLANHVAMILERNRSEEALRQSEIKLQCITSAAFDAIVMINPAGRISYWNRAAEVVLGYREHEVLGRDAHALLAPPQYHERYSHAFEDFRHTGRGNVVGRPVELEARRRDGSLVPIELTLGAMQVGDAWQAVAVIRDISSRKQVEDELLQAKRKAEQSDRLKTMLLNNMSHELRTPMNGILGFAGLLVEDLQNPFDKEMAEKILESGLRLLRTLDSVIDLSAVQSETVKVELIPVPIAPVIQAAVAPYRQACTEKGLYLTLDCPDDMGVLGDARLLERVLDYLFDNAVKYTRIGGIRVSIESVLHRRKSFVNIHVSDSGIGIEEENLELIFSEFRQESEGYGRDFEGTGVGLTLARKLTELMKGTLTVRSRKGEGSVFTVRLPATREVSAEAPEDVPEIPDSEELPAVLLVEDNHINIDLVVTFLHGRFDVDYAIDGPSAVEAAGRRRYAAVLMDIHLGRGMDGLEAARIIRRLPGCDAVPIIALTGYALSSDEERILAGGCTHYLAKPFTRTELLSIMQRALKN